MMKTKITTVALIAALYGSASAAVNIDWVTIGDPGNAAQSAANRTHSFGSGGDGYGAVADTFRIARNETTISQYATFLNAVATTDPYNLYNGNMTSDTAIASISRSGTSGSYSYSVLGSGDRPITYASWFDAARFANWLHNGQGNGDTETGAYTLNGATSGTAPVRNVGATVWIPTENEWFKAAYYDPTHMSGAGGYWLHANQSNSMSSNNFSTDGAANFMDGNYAKSENGLPTFLSDAGAYGLDSQNYYGLNDMAGNVFEWNDLAGEVDSSRGQRGGSWAATFEPQLRSSTRYTGSTSGEFGHIGFRRASVPEPSSLVLASAAICVLLRRKRPATTAAILFAPLLMTSCSELGRMEASVTGSSEGGDVPRTLQFQNYRFRTGAAFKAAQLGAVGVKRTSGPNVFEIKRIPELEGLHLSRSASFTKTDKSGFKMVGNVTISDFKGMKAGGSGEYSMQMYESGIYTIYYLPSTHGLVSQLNNDDNIELREYLRQSKDFRIITALVKVNSHSLLRSQSGSGKVNLQAIDALQKEGTATATTENAEASPETADKKVEITDDGKTSEKLPGGVSIADGGTYAYEYSRVIWDLNTGKILDLLADHPGRWYSFTDHADHHYQNATHDPRKLVKVNR